MAGVLCLDHIGVHDNLSGLGGHSLAAAQVVVQLQQGGFSAK